MTGPAETGALWPTILGICGTVAGILVGFGLNELSSLFRTRRDDRRTIAKALVELLEVRHQLKALPVMVEKMKALIPVPCPPNEELMLRRAIWASLPNTEGLQKRYDDAVSAVAAAFPILAFRLRSKDALGPYIGRLRGTLPIAPNDAALWLKIEDGIVQAALPKLDELITELARLHGRSTSHSVKRVLNLPPELPVEYERLVIEPIVAKAVEAQAAQRAQSEVNGRK